MKEDQITWFQNMSNPYRFGMKKYCFEILKEKYGLYEEAVETIASSVSSKEDYEKIGKLLLAIYELGYIKSVSDHRASLEKLGLNATIVQSEKSG